MDKLLLKDEIQRLLDKRKNLLDEYEDFWDEESMSYTIEEPKEIDELSEKIIEKIVTGREFLEIDFIIESITHLGAAPNLLYDDNGYFAMTSDGYQTVVSESPADIETSFLVPARKWKPNIREAVIYYLLEDEEDE